MGRERDMMFDLAKAIYAGDLGKAREELAAMRRAGVNANVIMEARQAAHPLPAPAPLREALVLPLAGHRPGSMMGSPRLMKTA